MTANGFATQPELSRDFLYTDDPKRGCSHSRLSGGELKHPHQIGLDVVRRDLGPTQNEQGAA